MKPTICLDFDGVIHSYPAWKGIVPTDPPTEGARGAIAILREQGYRVVVYSTRCASDEGYNAINVWLDEHEIDVDEVVREKPKAVLVVDDRGYRFDGDWGRLLTLTAGGRAALEPWNRKGRA